MFGMQSSAWSVRVRRMLAISVVAIAMFVPAILVGGCGVVSAIQGSRSTSVLLVNDGTAEVQVTLFYDDDQNVLDGVLQETGNQRTFVVQPGEEATFSRPCDDLQAVIVDDADLDVVGDFGPQVTSDLLRDGDDFNCGDTIVFTFTNSDIIVDFEVRVTIR